MTTQTRTNSTAAVDAIAVPVIGPYDHVKKADTRPAKMAIDLQKKEFAELTTMGAIAADRQTESSINSLDTWADAGGNILGALANLIAADFIGHAAQIAKALYIKYLDNPKRFKVAWFALLSAANYHGQNNHHINRGPIKIHTDNNEVPPVCEFIKAVKKGKPAVTVAPIKALAAMNAEQVATVFMDKDVAALLDDTVIMQKAKAQVQAEVTHHNAETLKSLETEKSERVADNNRAGNQIVDLNNQIVGLNTTVEKLQLELRSAVERYHSAEKALDAAKAQQRTKAKTKR